VIFNSWSVKRCIWKHFCVVRNAIRVIREGLLYCTIAKWGPNMSALCEWCLWTHIIMYRWHLWKFPSLSVSLHAVRNKPTEIPVLSLLLFPKQRSTKYLYWHQQPLPRTYKVITIQFHPRRHAFSCPFFWSPQFLTQTDWLWGSKTLILDTRHLHHHSKHFS
jgi:hypothetical protein